MAKSKFKKATAALLSGIMAFSVFMSVPLTAGAAETTTESVSYSGTVTDSGSCGDNVTYALYDDDTLVISGTGDMKNFRYDRDEDLEDTNIPWYYSYITSVVIEDGVTSIGDYAFRTYRSRLTSVTIPDSVTSIGDYAFYDCERLTSITIPDSVTSIGNSAFSNCGSLTSITIPDSVTSIGDYAFCNCDGLTSITIPDSVTSIGKKAFYLCNFLTSINIDENNTTYSSENGVLFNKDKTELIICPEGKSGKYTIPNSVTSIGDGAFEYCDSLTSITIPNSVTSIGDYAFYGCDKLTSITIPDNVTSIGDWAFWLCDSLASVAIGNGVTNIGDNAFCSCDSLVDVTIGNSVTSIGEDAFAYCDNLVSITIPDSVTSIGEYAFYYCSSLTSVTIGSGLTSISDHMFGNCDSLTSVTIPDSVTSIGGCAFYNCDGLTSITIPESVNSIGEQAFGYTYDDENWETVKIDDFTIYGYTGTAAETYANDNGFDFVSLGEATEPTTTEPTTTEPTTTKPTTTEPTTTEPVTTEPVTTPSSSTVNSNLTVNITSNFFSSSSVTYSGAKQIYVTYTLDAKMKVENFQAAISYDPTVLSPADGYNEVYYSESQNKCYAFPEFDLETIVYNPVSTSGKITFNGSDILNGYDLIGGKTFVTVAFDVIDSEATETTVDLDMQVLTFAEYDESGSGSEVLVVNGSIVNTEAFETTVNSATSYSTAKSDTAPSTPTTTIEIGDVSGDGTIDISDATAIQKAVAKITELTDAQQKAADVNGDGTVDISDATMIQKFVAKIITSFTAA